MQQIVDIYVDKEDHVWVINRASDARPDELGATTTPPRTECCIIGPEIVEFDTDGSVLRAWGGKDYVPGWPGRLQTLGVDRDENVWISGTMPGDSIIKFEGGDSRRENVRLLVILLYFRGRNFGSAMTEVPQELSVF